MGISLIWWTVLAEALLIVLLVWICVRLGQKISKERFLRRSQSTRYGQMTEQFLPLVGAYPWDSSNFRFLGSPIDGVQFENDKVILVEFKSGRSKLSRRQKEIRDLVNEGKVEFKELRVE